MATALKLVTERHYPELSVGVFETRGSLHASVRDGEKGNSGAHIVADYRGIPVLSVYVPVDFNGQPLALLAEIDNAEVLGETKP